MRNLIRALSCTLALAALPALAQAAVFVSVSIAPPALPVYELPPEPGPGYLWTPGYWAWDGAEYYWVPGTWVLAPVGLLWTPGYWGWGDGAYAWHEGYWGPQVGFYGGVDYGFGYPGVGYRGGEWRGREFIENRAIVHNVTTNRVSFNGGQGGITARPTSREMAAAREHHVAPIQVQRQQERMAAQSREMRASVNGGRPPIAATPRPGVFSGAGVVAARNSASARAGGFRTAERPNGAERPNTAERPNAGSRGNTAPAPARGNSFAPPRGSAEPQREAPRGAFPQTQREGRGPQSRPQEMRPQERPALQARPPQRAERPQPQERAPQREQPRPQPQREERPQQREERPQQRDERRPQEPPHPTLR